MPTSRAKSSSDLPAVFVLGGGGNGLGVLHDLADTCPHIEVFDVDPSNIAFASRYAARCHLVDRRAVESAMKMICERAKEVGNRPVLVICSDWFLNCVSQFRDTLEPYARFNLPDHEVVKNVLSKARFADFSENTDLPIARALAVTDARLEAVRAGRPPHVGFPLVIKPALSGGWDAIPGAPTGSDRKAKILFNSAELVAYSQTHADAVLGSVLQEYIDADDDEHYSFVSYVGLDGREMSSFGIRKLRINPPHAGVATFCEAVDDEALAVAGRQIIRQLHYRGIASVCFKRCRRTGAMVCYEVNGRLPLVHTVGRLLGVSMVRTLYSDLAGRELSPDTGFGRHSQGRWLRVGGDLAAAHRYVRLGELTWWKWLRTLPSVSEVAEWSWRDPFPCVLAIAHAAGLRSSRAKRLLGRVRKTERRSSTGD